MYTKRQKGWLKHLDFIILDYIAMVVAYYLGYAFRNGVSVVSMFQSNLYLRLFLVLVILQICVVLTTQSYKSIIRRSYLAELRFSVLQSVEVDALMLTYLFVIGQTKMYSRQSLLTFFALQILFTYVLRGIWKHYLRLKMLKSNHVEQMLILTDLAHAKQCVTELSMDCFRNYQIVGVILKDYDTLDWDPKEEIAQHEMKLQEAENTEAAVSLEENDELEHFVSGVPIVAGYSQIAEYLLENVVDSVFIRVHLDEPEKSRLLRHLVRSGVTVHYTLTRLRRNRQDKTIEQIGNYTVMTTSMRLTTKKQLFLKRLMDIFGGIVGVIFTAILTIIFGPIIYIQSPGPIFFTQKRMGMNGRVFNIYKFRSMYMDAEERKKELMAQNEMEGFMFKMENDPRIIPIGRFIRKYSIDEFPQFLNVLKGDMSLVGTRPPTVDEYEQYSLHHRGRLSSKPGITGMWQISGRSDITDFEEVVELDTNYISEWSIKGDITILIRTVWQVLHGSGAK